MSAKRAAWVFCFLTVTFGFLGEAMPVIWPISSDAPGWIVAAVLVGLPVSVIGLIVSSAARAA